MSIKHSNSGRKPKYPTDLLIDKLNEYISINPDKQVKIASLSKFTDIPYYIWRDNPKINEILDCLHDKTLLINTKSMDLQLPSAKDLIDSHYNNKKNLTIAISNLLNLTSELSEKALKWERVSSIEAEYKVKIKALELIISKKDNEIQKMNTEIDRLYFVSRNPLERKKIGLKDNLIELELSRKNTTSKNISDIENEFKALFED